MKDLKTILSAYTVKVTPQSVEDGSGFKAVYEEIGSTVRGVGANLVDAVAELEDIALDTLTEIPLVEFPAARQEAAWAEYSGRVTLRLPKMLHGQLDRLADEQGVSLNQFMSHALQSAATATMAGEEFGVCSRSKADEISESLAMLRGYLDEWSMYDFPEKGERGTYEMSKNNGTQRRDRPQLHYLTLEEAQVA